MVIDVLPKKVQAFVKAAGVVTDTEFAWSWNAAELKMDLEKFGIEGAEVSTALMQLAAARSSSIKDMEAMTVAPSPVAVRPAGQSCAPARREKGQKGPYPWKSSQPG